MWSIRQVGENEWEVLRGGERFGATVPTYGAALAVIEGELNAVEARAQLANDEGLLPEVWEDTGGIAFSQETGDGRDFTNCTWSARDPSTSLLPLMLQTETEIGHFGAVLAGFIESVDGLGQGTTPRASGRFYDSETGVQARDLLLGDRSFGVSLDPGHVAAEWECATYDDEGWCIEDRISFIEYDIMGLTLTPFPAFADAGIHLRGGSSSTSSSDTAGGEGDAVAASAASTLSIPVRPPAAWFAVPEPQPGQTGMLDVYGMPVQELLVEQPDGAMAVPLTILDSGLMFGHLARAGQGHRGNERLQPPASSCGYAHFHVGEVVCEGGERIATGALVAGCDHAETFGLTAEQARDHYAHNGLAWADVRIVDGALGPWVCGALRPTVTDAMLRVLRAGALSGDWRRYGSNLELITALAVNAPGFPISRNAVTASGLPMLPEVRARGAQVDEVPTALVASAMVHRCQACQERLSRELGGPRPAESTVTVMFDGETRDLLHHIGRRLDTLELRTRHLRADARDSIRERLAASR